MCTTVLMFWERCERCQLLFVAEDTLYGPMHSKQGVDQYKAALLDVEQYGGKIEFGGKVGLLPYPVEHFVDMFSVY